MLPRFWKVGAAMAGLALALGFAAPTAARNRTTEMLVSDVAAGAGVSYDTFRRRADTQDGDDLELMPGVFESTGGFSYAFNGQQRTLIAVRIFNENSFAICVRSNAALMGGPMVGSEKGESLGYNVLIEPGTSEPVIAHTSTRVHGVAESIRYATRYFFWSAAPPSQQRRCSSVAPAGVESVDRAPLPAAGQTSWQSTPELQARLGLVPSPSSAPPQSAPAAQQAPVNPADRLAWYWLSRINPEGSGPVKRGGILTNEYGPFVTSLAIGRLGINAERDSWTATDWFYNTSDRSVCVLGVGSYWVLSAKAGRKSVEEGAKVVPPNYGTWLAGVQHLQVSAPPSWTMLWEVDLYDPGLVKIPLNGSFC